MLHAGFRPGCEAHLAETPTAAHGTPHRAAARCPRSSRSAADGLCSHDDHTSHSPHIDREQGTYNEGCNSPGPFVFAPSNYSSTNSSKLLETDTIRQPNIRKQRDRGRQIRHPNGRTDQAPSTRACCQSTYRCNLEKVTSLFAPLLLLVRRSQRSSQAGAFAYRAAPIRFSLLRSKGC
jgi:hypothetical protein